jgi:hypothetical protein
VKDLTTGVSGRGDASRLHALGALSLVPFLPLFLRLPGFSSSWHLLPPNPAHTPQRQHMRAQHTQRTRHTHSQRRARRQEQLTAGSRLAKSLPRPCDGRRAFYSYIYVLPFRAPPSPHQENNKTTPQKSKIQKKRAQATTTHKSMRRYLTL